MADHIWVVRDPSGELIGSSHRSAAGAISDYFNLDDEWGVVTELLDAADAEQYPVTTASGYTLTREPLPAPVAANAETFTAWLCEQMPSGTVIGDPKWWAPKILQAVRAFTEVPAPVAASEPVAWALYWADGGLSDITTNWPFASQFHRNEEGARAVPLYAHPSTAGVSVTDAMVEAAAKEWYYHESIPTLKRWDKVPDYKRDRYRSFARSALTAAITAASEVQPS